MNFYFATKSPNSISSRPSSSSSPSCSDLGWTLFPATTMLDGSTSSGTPTTVDEASGAGDSDVVVVLRQQLVTTAVVAAESNEATTEMAMADAHVGPRHAQASPTSWTEGGGLKKSTKKRPFEKRKLTV